MVYDDDTLDPPHNRIRVGDPPTPRRQINPLEDAKQRVTAPHVSPTLLVALISIVLAAASAVISDLLFDDPTARPSTTDR